MTRCVYPFPGPGTPSPWTRVPPALMTGPETTLLCNGLPPGGRPLYRPLVTVYPQGVDCYTKVWSCDRPDRRSFWCLCVVFASDYETGRELCLGDRPDRSSLGASKVSNAQYSEHVLFQFAVNSPTNVL